MKNKIKKGITTCLILFSTILWAQDISNLEKSELEAKVKEMVIKEANTNPFFEEFAISNSNPVKFKKFPSEIDYSYITDKKHELYGVEKGDYFMLADFYNKNEEFVIIKAVVLLKTSEITYMRRGGKDNLGLFKSGLLNNK